MDTEQEYKEIFSKRLRTLRKEKEFKQEDLAEKLHISTTVMSRLENGETSPKFSTLIKIVQIFNVSLDYLVGFSDNKKISKRNTSETKNTPKFKSTISRDVVEGTLTPLLDYTNLRKF